MTRQSRSTDAAERAAHRVDRDAELHSDLSELTTLYQMAGQPMPPDHLEGRIRAHARADHARVLRPLGPWTAAAGLAASALVGIAVLVTTPHVDEASGPTEASSSARDLRSAETPRAAPAPPDPSGLTDAGVQDSDRTQGPAEAPASTDNAASEGTSGGTARSPGDAQDSAAQPRQSPESPAPGLSAESRDENRSELPPADAGALTRRSARHGGDDPLPEDATQPRSPSERAGIALDAPPTAEGLLQEIQALLDAGEYVAVRRKVAAFKALFPDMDLPESARRALEAGSTEFRPGQRTADSPDGP